MYYTIVATIWMLAGLLAGIGILALRRRFPKSTSTLPVLIAYGLVLAGGALFGFGLAMLFDRWLGAWGILCAAALCGGLCVALFRMLRPVAPGEEA